MIISRGLLDVLHESLPVYPPESGGILGSLDGRKIDNVVFDIPSQESAMGCAYSPNVNFLNNQIKQWQCCGIHFMGIFHTHFYGIRTLSLADKKYIKTIMCTMPSSINCLLFPIYVLPKRIFIGYRAIRKDGCVEIENEEVVEE